MKFTIKCKKSFLNERKWVLDTILSDYLGLNYVFQTDSNNFITIERNNHKLNISDFFFSNLDNHWLQPVSLPKQPLKLCDKSLVKFSGVSNKKVPIIYGDDGFTVNKTSINLGLDIFGSAFFMMSRYEEVIKLDRDIHDRFPSHASLAFQENFLHRPLINEYIVLLISCLNFLWPDIIIKKRSFQMMISCDVDQPYQCGIKNFKKQTKTILADLLVRKSMQRAKNSFLNYFFSKSDNYSYDINYQNIVWMIEENNKASNRVSFNFIAYHSDNTFDGCYFLDENIINKLIVFIDTNNHIIGLHTSYNTFRDKKQTIFEANYLKSHLSKLSINPNIQQVRQHYLRWDSLYTPGYLSETGIVMDSTLGYADHPGFRCGICYEFQLYDLLNRKILPIYEFPLIVMDCSVISSSYMGLGYTKKALQLMIDYKNTCKQYNGNFTFLWHNSQFETEFSYEMYRQLVS